MEKFKEIFIESKTITPRELTKAVRQSENGIKIKVNVGKYKGKTFTITGDDEIYSDGYVELKSGESFDNDEFTITEAKTASIKELQNLIKKNGQVAVINSNDVWVNIDEISDGIAYGINQFDDDEEIDLNKEKVTLA